MMSRYDAATADFRWLLNDVVAFRDVLALPAFAELNQDIVDEVIETAGAFISEVIAPVNEASDRIGVTLSSGRVVTPPGWKEAYAAWCENGWPGLGAPVEYGGQGMPFVVQAALASMLAGADLAFSMLVAGARGASLVLRSHGKFDGVDICIEKLASGAWGGTIVMTEPQAGSDVGQIKTRAVRREDGRYSLTGSKIFISGGDTDLTEQILHIVLARSVQGSTGTSGLSLFVVPSERFDADGRLLGRNGVSVSSIEKKMGLHGSATCALNFDDAEGILLGREGGGLEAMFTMMNELRLEVALSAVGLATSATHHAIAYAHERRQGRSASGTGPVPIAEHPDVQRMLSMMRVLTEGGRALVLETARFIDLAVHAGTEDERARAAALVGWLLPICKASLSDNCVTVASLGIQIRGGHGYVRESGAEQFLRDARILPIYEGTNGIQAIDLVSRKLLRDRGAAFRRFAELVRADLERHSGKADTAGIHSAVEAGLAMLERVSERLLASGKDGQRKAIAGASAYLDLAGRVCLGWMWLRMAAADSRAGHVVAEKRRLADFFADYYEPEFELYAKRVERALVS
jgi:alkylation response protein AidB-like acyl-CoA dehydrogenase